jgi:hypothetical protein
VTRLSQVAPALREEFLRDGVLNAIWLAHSCQSAVGALTHAAEVPLPEGITAEQGVRRGALFVLARGFLEKQRDEQFVRAHEHLRIWMTFKAGELSDDYELPT